MNPDPDHMDGNRSMLDIYKIGCLFSLIASNQMIAMNYVLLYLNCKLY